MIETIDLSLIYKIRRRVGSAQIESPDMARALSEVYWRNIAITLADGVVHAIARYNTYRIVDVSLDLKVHVNYGSAG